VSGSVPTTTAAHTKTLSPPKLATYLDQYYLFETLLFIHVLEKCRIIDFTQYADNEIDNAIIDNIFIEPHHSSYLMIKKLVAPFWLKI